jgi:hypothetical protein
MRNISIVALHGTFATDAPWTKPNSQFAATLELELPGQRINWYFYNWSGANNHEAREQAANELQSKLNEITAGGEDNIHLISHSHGGNVALMSLCSEKRFPAVRSVTCLSTPFYIAEPRDIEHLLESAHGALTFKALFLQSLLYFATLEFLSNRMPGITEIGMAVYAVLIVLAAGTSAAVYAMRGKLSQQQLLQRYNYSKVTQPILALRVSLDEAFHLLNVNAKLASIPTGIYWLVSALFLILIPFSIVIGLVFVVPLIILSPLIYVSGQGIRFIVRAAPWAMGEGLLHSVLVNFATRHVLNLTNATNVEIPVAISETHGQLKLRHSALYSSQEVAKEIASFIRAASA